MLRWCWITKAITFLVGGAAIAVHADEPVASYIFPAGGQRGTTVNVRVGGLNLHDAPRFTIHGAGITAPKVLKRSEHSIWFEGPLIPLPDSQRQEDYPVDYDASLTIAPDATPGLRRWRVGTSQGVTRSLPFEIGNLPELIEEEIDGQPIPTVVSLPVTINGRIFPRADVDPWSFDAQAGETYVGEIRAERLESPLDARLSVRAPEGQTIAENDDAIGKDPLIIFTAPTTGRYVIAVSDAQDAGLQRDVYRLTLTRGPCITAVYPLGGRRGSIVPLELVQSHTTSINEPFPVSPDAATRIPVPKSRGLWLVTSDLEELLEREPNNSHESAMTAGVNTVLNGRIQVPGDVDYWRLDVEVGKPLDIELLAAKLGSPLDAVLTIRDIDGKILAEVDDGPNGQSDPQLTWTPSKTEAVYVGVKDRYARRGDARFGYRLLVRPTATLAPSVAVRMPTDGLSVPRGGEAKFKVAIEHQHGFQQPLTLSAAGLPAGLSVAEVTVPPNQKEATLVFKASADAAIQSTAVVIQARGEQDGRPVEAVASMEAIAPDDLLRTELHVAVALPTPFRVIGQFETKYAPRGSTFLRKYQIERNGFTGPLQVRLADRQARHLQGVTGPLLEIGANESEFTYPVQLPPWMEIGRTSRTCVMTIGTVTLEDGSQHVVSFSSQEQNNQIIVLVDPGQLSLQLDQPSLLAGPGQTAEIPFTVRRGTNITGTIRVELVVAPHIRGVSVVPIVLSGDQEHGKLSIRFDRDMPGPFNLPLTVRASSVRKEGLTTAEAKLEVVTASESKTTR